MDTKYKFFESIFDAQNQVITAIVPITKGIVHGPFTYRGDSYFSHYNEKMGFWTIYNLRSGFKQSSEMDPFYQIVEGHFAFSRVGDLRNTTLLHDNIAKQVQHEGYDTGEIEFTVRREPEEIASLFDFDPKEFQQKFPILKHEMIKEENPEAVKVFMDNMRKIRKVYMKKVPANRNNRTFRNQSKAFIEKFGMLSTYMEMQSDDFNPLYPSDIKEAVHRFYSEGTISYSLIKKLSLKQAMYLLEIITNEGRSIPFMGISFSPEEFSFNDNFLSTMKKLTEYITYKAEVTSFPPIRYIDRSTYFTGLISTFHEISHVLEKNLVSRLVDISLEAIASRNFISISSYTAVPVFIPLSIKETEDFVYKKVEFKIVKQTLLENENYYYIPYFSASGYMVPLLPSLTAVDDNVAEKLLKPFKDPETSKKKLEAFVNKRGVDAVVKMDHTYERNVENIIRNVLKKEGNVRA